MRNICKNRARTEKTEYTKPLPRVDWGEGLLFFGVYEFAGRFYLICDCFLHASGGPISDPPEMGERASGEETSRFPLVESLSSEVDGASGFVGGSLRV